MWNNLIERAGSQNQEPDAGVICREVLWRRPRKYGDESSQARPIFMPKYRWLKFRVTEEEYKDAKKTFTDSGERWFWRWCQKLFSKGVSEQRMKDFKP